MKAGPILLTVVLSAVTALGTVYLSGALPSAAKHEAPVQLAAREPAYERVMRTSTLRCGYLFYPKFIEKDLNTGKLSGMYIDIMEEIGRQTSLKIEWTEEVGFATAFDGLETGRYDAVCFPFNQTPGRARVTAFTVPLIFAPSFLYARADDHRFDNAYVRVNDPSVKVAVLEGEMSQTIKKEEFPKAQTVSMPDITDISQVLLQVAMGKADIAMTEPSSSEPFLLGNPGKLKRVSGPALRMQAAGLNVGVGENALKDLLDTTIRAMLSTGFVEKTINKYTTSPDQFYVPANPWGQSSQPVQLEKP